MGLINKLLGRGPADTRPGASTQFADSESEDIAKSRSAPRREVLHVVLRETMRKHGIPSDWIDSRALSVATEGHKPGMHVQFVVRRSDEQLLPYVHAFQQSFRDELLRVDPSAKNWLLGIAWEFNGTGVHDFATMPARGSWRSTGVEAHTTDGDTLPPDDAEDDLTSDLQALQALISAPAEAPQGADAAPGRRDGAH